ncbi:hypothetical protein [Poriferisphaera sp. WC338]|uniref:hypothetical protein n=1 Tax=Poriferisphaera sp. WC338 TaxID=3425129 RepID=UPI003D813E38
MIHRRLKCSAMIACTAMCVCLTSYATAGVIVSESFEYNTGTVYTKNGGIGWGGAWSGPTNNSTSLVVDQNPVTPPASYGSPVGNHVLITANGHTGRIERSLASAIDLNPTQTTTYYMSMLFRRDDNAPTNGSENSTFFRLENSSNSTLVYVGQSSSEAVEVKIGNDKVTAASGTVGVGVDTLLVMKLTLSPSGQNDTLQASLFTTDPVTESWQYSATDDASGTIVQFAIGQPRFAEQLAVDEIRIGTTFDDVTSIPEPAALSLFSVGLLFLSKRANH